LQDPRAVELLKATAEKAGWLAHTAPQSQPIQGDLLQGQGVGYARYNHSKWPGFGAAWAAWVADVEVNRRTGEVHVRRVVVGHDAGTLINPAGVQHQIHGNVVQTTSRALLEEVKFNPQSATNPGTVANLEWGSYPILHFRDVPLIDIVTMPRQGEPPLGAGESSSVPGTAAIANAIFDATGVRFRQPPFTPEVVLAGLAGHDSKYKNDLQPNKYGNKKLLNNEQSDRSLPASAIWPKPAKRWLQAGGVLAGLFGLAVALVGWRSVIAPVPLTVANIYSPATIERGRQLAALGNCVGCHTATDIDGWEAPALTALSRAPVPWNAAELYRYLRVGHTQQHGIAAGPMGAVVTELGALPDADIAAMASYLASFNPPITDAQSQASAIELVATARQPASTFLGPGQRLFSGACGSCHHDGDGPKLLGVNPPLALNSNLHSSKPDNLINIILNGVQEPATRDIGYMPAFKHALNDAQIAELARYMRSRYAPGEAAWRNLPADIARLRKTDVK
jgi:mono/diheme cytochrome c family protein